MDLDAAIEINRQALKRVLVLLIAMAEFGGASAPRSTLPRHLHCAVLRLLRPAEAAARRLVIVAARGISVTLVSRRPRKAKAGLPFVRNGFGTGIVLPYGVAYPGHAAMPTVQPRAYGFALFDPLRPPFRRRRPRQAGLPRIWAPGCRDPSAVPVRKPPMPNDPVNAARLGLRLAGLACALDDLPKHAMRFARWRNRVAAGAQDEGRAAAGTQDGQWTTAGRRVGRSRFHRLSPLRPGPPPGSLSGNSRRSAHEVHEILARAYGLAFWVLQHRDTS